MKSMLSVGRAVLLLVVLLAGQAFGQPAADGAGIPVVKNSSVAAKGIQTLQLEEMWRAGGEDSEVIFGHIFRAEADAAGNVYLLDTQLSEVPVFAPDGEHIKTLSREGEGPGETHEPVDLTMLPGGSLGILQRFPGKVVKIDLEGTPLGDINIGDPAAGGFNAVFTGRCKGDNLILVAQHVVQSETAQTRTWYVSRFDEAGQELARCWSRDCRVDFARPVIREADILEVTIFASAPGPDGRVYIAPNRHRYAIEVFSPSGELDHVIEREFQARQRNELEKGRLQTVFDFWASRNPNGMESEVEEVAATIAGLYVDDAGYLWVENSRSSEVGKTGAMLIYDVFDPQGVFDRQVALACEGDPVDDQLFWVRDDMVVLVKGSIPALYASMAGGAADSIEDEQSMEMEVVCYRVPR